MSYDQRILDRLKSDLALESRIEFEKVVNIFKEMGGVDQTSNYHREGDVLTHTHMVVEALDELLKDKEGDVDYVNNPVHRVLLFAAWFHDVGKVSTKKWSDKKQRNTFNGHEEVSAREWRKLYLEFELDPLFGEQIFELIRSHPAPTNYIKSHALNSTYEFLARRVCPYHLYLLSLADMRGRLCDDEQTLIQTVESFKEKCESLQILDNNRFKYYKLSSLSELAYIVKHKRCLLLPIGVPGCGKSYLLNQLQQFYPDTVIVCPDDIRTELYGEDWSENYQEVDNGKVFGLANHRLKQAMQSKHCLIYFDAQNASIKDRKVKVEMATKYNLAVICFWFRTKYQTILEQNNNRGGKVPEKYIERAMGHLQLPLLTESDYVVELSPR